MALEKYTKGKPVREREILLLGNLQQNSEIFRPTYLNSEEKISASFSAPNRKNQTYIFSFSFFYLDFHVVVRTVHAKCTECILQTNCTDLNIHAHKKYSQKSCPKIYLKKCARCFKNCTVRSRNKCCCPLFDFSSLFVVVLSSNCMLQNFPFYLRQGNFSSQLSLVTSICKSKAKCLSHAFLRKP